MVGPKINIAVVEDNGMARILLRNHLLEMGYSNVSCYIHGRELKKALKVRQFDLILMDFHLGDHKNGVEVIQELNREKLLKNTTSLIFVTSDRLPLIIGQIVDIHPDDLVIKPYTIRILEKTIANVLRIRRHLMPVLTLMDEKLWDVALQKLEQIAKSNSIPKSRTTLLKIRARLLLKLSRFDEATALYDSVLQSAENVIWAKWGVIHAQYLAGKIEISEELLKDMLGAHLTNDKACEWLARICIGRKEYEEAEEYIDLIKESALSMTAAKLKSYVYQLQNKMDKAIDLLERKRLNAKDIREKYAELSLELARCYLSIAESKQANERANALQVARFLIGNAGRNYLEENLAIKRDYMNILVAVLENDQDKAVALLEEADQKDFTTADVPTMTDAIKAWLGVGDELRAAQILFDCEEKMLETEDLTDQTISSMVIAQQEEELGERRPRALKFNKQGLNLHNQQRYQESVDYFYQAYLLFPKEAAFGLNLLQGLLESNLAEYKKAKTLRLFNELDKRELSNSNRKRLNEIGGRLSADKERFIIKDNDKLTTHS
ncbi:MULTISPECIES: response regulator [Alteromonadaceae]|uniref:response regulator n=1 Tax=Alteromonadaceae TaxID=72275 RepID=UPI001C08AAA0|nr:MULTISPECIES: response regulator [unclassified Aliiglaciecola]MBU2877336.1 response regulator [Aliiglaciecola lipolytica]MDO6712984.1 response regulator [Aliiglaciecola sp. 2_MG-2023]MDO6754023.1 response regulator [Aliiglaciecola sp. 1_MG-2023]